MPLVAISYFLAFAMHSDERNKPLPALDEDLSTLKTESYRIFNRYCATPNSATEQLCSHLRSTLDYRTSDIIAPLEAAWLARILRWTHVGVGVGVSRSHCAMSLSLNLNLIRR